MNERNRKGLVFALEYTAGIARSDPHRWTPKRREAYLTMLAALIDCECDFEAAPVVVSVPAKHRARRRGPRVKPNDWSHLVPVGESWDVATRERVTT